MDFKKIEKEWRAGNHQIAIRLLESMIFEAGLTQKRVSNYSIGSDRNVWEKREADAASTGEQHRRWCSRSIARMGKKRGKSESPWACYRCFGQHNQDMPCKEVIDMISDEEKLIYETERFPHLCNPFGSLDIREALRFGLEFDLNEDKIFELAQQFTHKTGFPFEELDIVYIVYEHVLQEARDRIYEATGYDFEIYTLGSFQATYYDYTEEERERLLSEITGLDIEIREALLDDCLLRFLKYSDITKEDIEREAERSHEEILETGDIFASGKPKQEVKP